MKHNKLVGNILMTYKDGTSENGEVREGGRINKQTEKILMMIKKNMSEFEGEG